MAPSPRQIALPAALLKNPRLLAIGAVIALVVVLLPVWLLTRGPSDEERRAAEERWGLSAVADPQEASYRDDVVVIDEGAWSVKGASGDRLTYYLDDDAGGLDDLEVGSVMFATTRVVGRVVEIKDRDGGQKAVTLAPVDLTEVIKDADLVFDTEVKASDFKRTVTPDPVAALTVPPKQEEPEPSPTPTTKSAAFVAVEDPKPPTKETGEVSVGPWSVEASFSDTDISFKGQRGFGAKEKLKFGLESQLVYDDLHLSGNVGIRDGAYTANPTMVLEGLKQLKISLVGGAPQGLKDNAKARVEIPIDLTQQVVISGVPMIVQLKIKFYVATGFSAKNASFSAQGIYNLAGPLGVMAGKPVAPALTVLSPMLHNFSGVSMGIDSTVFAAESRIMVGFGIEQFASGPYAKLTFSGSTLRGSDLLAPWGVPCQVTLMVEGGFGMALQLNTEVITALQKRLKGWTLPKVELELGERTRKVVNRTAKLRNCPAGMPATTTASTPPPFEATAQGQDPFTGTAAPPVPGPGARPRPPSDGPVSQGQENPADPNQNYGEDGQPTGAVPPPKPGPEGEEEMECLFPYGLDGRPLIKIEGHDAEEMECAEPAPDPPDPKKPNAPEQKTGQPV